MFWFLRKSSVNRRLVILACRRHSTNVSEHVSIPKRIPRGPTDILKALASTVKQDETAVHFKYHDDPFLTPMGNMRKREFSLAKESGRQAARYFLDNYPHLFYRDDAEPKIPAFSYKDSFTSETVVDETDLINCIKCRQVLNAVQVFKNCRQQKAPICQEVLQSLLELVCFNNSKDGADYEFLEQLWFHQREQRSDSRKTWMTDSSAEEIFDSMDRTPQAIATMICGLGRYNAVEKGFKLYEDSRTKNIILDTETYNHILKMVSFLRANGSARWDLILDILADMKSVDVMPDIGTLNEILDVLSRSTTWRQSMNVALKTLCEFRQLGIEPSLATYYLLLQIFTKDKTGGSAPHVLYTIMDQIGETEITVRHPKDVLFFNYAMTVAADMLNDVELAYRIHRVLSVGNNYRLLPDSLSESAYFRNFMTLICNCETMDKIMEFYDKYVPNVFIPEPRSISEILKAIQLHDAYDVFPRIFSDNINFGFSMVPSIAQEQFLILATKMKDPQLQEKFADLTKLALGEMKRIDETTTNTPSTTVLNCENYSSCMMAFLNSDDMEGANEILQLLIDKQNVLPGFAHTEYLQEFAAKCLETKDIPKLISCLKYATDVGNDHVLKFVAQKMDQLPKDHPNRRRVEEFVNAVE